MTIGTPKVCIKRIFFIIFWVSCHYIFFSRFYLLECLSGALIIEGDLMHLEFYNSYFIDENAICSSTGF